MMSIGCICGSKGLSSFYRARRRNLKVLGGSSHVKVVPSPSGDITSFLMMKSSSNCFVTSEPIAARRKGVPVKVFAVYEIGYDPYTTALTVSGESLSKNPDRAKAMVAAVRQDGARTWTTPK